MSKIFESDKKTHQKEKNNLIFLIGERDPSSIFVSLFFSQFRKGISHLIFRNVYYFAEHFSMALNILLQHYVE